MSDPATVSKEAFDLAIAQAEHAERNLQVLGGVVSALGMFIGYKLFGLVQLVVTAIQNNTAALQDLKERSNGKGN